jgi:hypothetical protein
MCSNDDNFSLLQSSSVAINTEPISTEHEITEPVVPLFTIAWDSKILERPSPKNILGRAILFSFLCLVYRTCCVSLAAAAAISRWNSNSILRGTCHDITVLGRAI